MTFEQYWSDDKEKDKILQIIEKHGWTLESRQIKEICALVFDGGHKHGWSDALTLVAKQRDAPTKYGLGKNDDI